MALQHQCGGYSCEQQVMIATRLTLRRSIMEPLRSIAREGYFAETGHFDRDQLLASRLTTYLKSLSNLGLDCECTWRMLTESLYPIDATQKNLNLVAEDVLDLKSLAQWHYPPVRYLSEPVILFMTKNSD